MVGTELTKITRKAGRDIKGLAEITFGKFFTGKVLRKSL